MKGLPVSEAVQVGNLLFLSGQLGLDADGKLVPGGIGSARRFYATLAVVPRPVPLTVAPAGVVAV